MAKVKITCDSTCDLTRELYQKNQVSVLSLGVSLGDDFRLDGVNVQADDLYDYVEKTGSLPKTCAISLGDYQEAFSKWVKEGYEVVHISLSSKLSTSHQSACIAAEEVGNVYVVDSKSLSTGSGHLVLLACQMAQQGMSGPEIARELEGLREKVDASFIIQTLQYLHKGGRCSGVAVFGANLMKIRPEIVLEEGSMHVGKKYRGSMEKTVLDYVRGRLEGRTDVDARRLIITHSGVPEALLEQVRKLATQLQPFREVLITRAGSTISCHCGPNCLGVLFLKK